MALLLLVEAVGFLIQAALLDFLLGKIALTAFHSLDWLSAVTVVLRAGSLVCKSRNNRRFRLSCEPRVCHPPNSPRDCHHFANTHQHEALAILDFSGLSDPTDKKLRILELQPIDVSLFAAKLAVQSLSNLHSWARKQGRRQPH